MVAPWIFLGNPLPGWLLQAQAEGGGAGAKEGALPSIVGSNRAREERDSEAGQQQHSHQLAGQGRLWLAQRQRWCVGGCECLMHAWGLLAAAPAQPPTDCCSILLLFVAPDTYQVNGSAWELCPFAGPLPGCLSREGYVCLQRTGLSKQAHQLPVKAGGCSCHGLLDGLGPLTHTGNMRADRQWKHAMAGIAANVMQHSPPMLTHWAVVACHSSTSRPECGKLFCCA